MSQPRPRPARLSITGGLSPTPAVLGQILASVFNELELSASLLGIEGSGRTWNWQPIYSAPQEVVSFELAHGVEKRRSEYNVQAVAKVYRSGKSVLAEHAGFHDLFTPIVQGGETRGLLVTGPFASARPTSTDLLSRWRFLTGSQGRISDPEFSHYLSMSLATATFEGPLLAAFRRLVQCLAELLSERGSVERLTARVQTLRGELGVTRYPERVWRAAHGLTDERTFRIWQSPFRARELRDMGVARTPQHVIVGLLLGRRNESDPIDEILRRDAFQRACVELFRKRSGVLCGRLADHGVVLLSDDAATGQRLRAKLGDIAQRAATLGKRFGLSLRLGISAPGDERSLPLRFQAALAAAEEALAKGVALSYAEREQHKSSSRLLVTVRRQFVGTLTEDIGSLARRFDRYLDLVVARVGFRLEPLRAQLDAALGQLLDGLRGSGVPDEKSLDDWQNALDRASTEAATVEELSRAYRDVVADIEASMLRPNQARQDRSVQRALSFIRDHFAERLTVARIARVAGFAPSYFSKVFRSDQGVTLKRYLRQVRIERARQMLLSTSFSAERIGRLCGFSNRTHFHRAFRQTLGASPLDYRKRGHAMPRLTTPKKNAALAKKSS